MFIKKLGRRFNKNDIGVIAKINVRLARIRDEDDIEVSKNIQLRFIDSCRFVASGLDKLVSNLDDNQCKNLREFYKEEEVFRLIRRQGIYP